MTGPLFYGRLVYPSDGLPSESRDFRRPIVIRARNKTRRMYSPGSAVVCRVVRMILSRVFRCCRVRVCPSVCPREFRSRRPSNECRTRWKRCPKTIRLPRHGPVHFLPSAVWCNKSAADRAGRRGVARRFRSVNGYERVCVCVCRWERGEVPGEFRLQCRFRLAYEIRKRVRAPAAIIGELSKVTAPR